MDAPESFYRDHLLPNVADFKKATATRFPSQLNSNAAIQINANIERTGMNAALSAFHLRDWMLETYEITDPTKIHNCTNKKTYQAKLANICPNFNLISDVANANKHLKLDSTRRYTNTITSAGSTLPTIVAHMPEDYSTLEIGAKIPLELKLIIDPTGRPIDFEVVLDDVAQMWKNELGL